MVDRLINNTNFVVTAEFVSDVKITLTEEQLAKNKLITISLPFKKGYVGQLSELVLVDDSSNSLFFHGKVTQYWDDKSIRWCVLEVPLYEVKSVTCILMVYKNGFFSDTSTPINVNIRELFPSLKLSHTKSKEGLRALKVIHNQFKSRINLSTSSICLDESNGIFFQPELTKNNKKIKFEVVTNTIETEVDLNEEVRKASVLLKGHFEVEDRKLSASINIIYRAYYSSVEMKVIIHNENAAKHSGGLWDLGDEGSIVFDDFSIVGNVDELSKLNVCFDGIQKDNLKQFEILQTGSGGKNWNNTNHVLADNLNLIKQNGYHALVDEEAFSGLRCNPRVEIKVNKYRLVCEVNRFWQNFPIGMSYKDKRFAVNLLANTNYSHELQGGEQKTHTIWLSINEQNAGLTNELLNGVVSSSYLVGTKAFFLTNESSLTNNKFTKLTALGLCGESNFFHKRELADEYGWRNFGDLFADHETIGEKGKAVKISHYNNQYDPIYGFLRQYVLTGDIRWFELAADLVSHVKDIDIYQTTNDRDEYNYGLFWHTDHYLDTMTCSHRTFSKHHEAAYEGYTSGGGPGGQHCYSLGLAYHYLLTGEESSKTTVLNMAKWIELTYDGSPTILGKLFAIKRRNSVGVKNPLTGQYPLDRGTGNLINTQLDAFLLTEDKKFLQKAGYILEHTIHPNDDISQRNLDNIEETWFYSVLLQSAVRYLLVKEELQDWDYSYYFVQAAFLHYADWVLQNEQPYLHRPEKLEFPNTTWAAQDIRKGYILAAASYFDQNKTNEYKRRSDEFFEYVFETLNSCENKSTTRTLALLMQNDGAKEFFSGKVCSAPSKKMAFNNNKPQNKYVAVIKLLFSQLRYTSIKKELRWLAFRSDKVSQKLGKYLDE